MRKTFCLCQIDPLIDQCRVVDALTMSSFWFHSYAALAGSLEQAPVNCKAEKMKRVSDHIRYTET